MKKTELISLAFLEIAMATMVMHWIVLALGMFGLLNENMIMASRLIWATTAIVALVISGVEEICDNKQSKKNQAN